MLCGTGNRGHRRCVWLVLASPAGAMDCRVRILGVRSLLRGGLCLTFSLYVCRIRDLFYPWVSLFGFGSSGHFRSFFARYLVVSSLSSLRPWLTRPFGTFLRELLPTSSLFATAFLLVGLRCWQWVQGFMWYRVLFQAYSIGVSQRSALAAC